VGDADDADAVAVGVHDGTRVGNVGREPRPVQSGVGNEPWLGRAGREFTRRLDPEIEVVIAEGVGVRVDCREEIQRHATLGRQRERAGCGVVAGPDDDRIAVASGGDSASDPGTLTRIVQRSFEIGVVEETQGHITTSRSSPINPSNPVV
jgi:hypothetical protein